MVTAMKDTTLDNENVDREKSVDIRRPMVNPSTTNIPNTTSISTSSSTNPCTLVRHSCFEFVKQDQCQKHVQINPDAIPILAQQILEKRQQQQQQQQDDHHHHHSAALLVEWDEENWHYSCQSSKQEPQKLSSNGRMVVVNDFVDTTTWPSTLRKERIAMYILALDAINFCFWKSQNDDTFTTTTTTSMTNTEMMIHDYKYEYDDLAQTLTNMATADHIHQQQQVVVVAQMQNSTTVDETTLLSSEFLLSPMHLQNMTLDRMIQLFQTYHPKNYQTMSNTNTDQVHSTPTTAASAAVSYVPPYMLERCQIWNEIGTVLMNPPFHGSILPLFEMVEEKYQQQQQQQSTSASSSKASILVQLLIEHFPNFRDDTKQRYYDEMSKQQLETRSNSEISPSESSSFITAGTPPPPPPILYFYKRAQICVGDLHAALAGANLQTDDNDASNHMDDITTFADYRVPQLLRHYHIIQYSTKLAQQIDTYEVLVQHSEEEYAIRASTIVVVELLVQELRRQHEPALLQEAASNDGIDIHSHHPSMIGTATTNSSCSARWNAMQTDWYLWKLGEKMEHKNELQPHHRVRTTFY